MNEELEALFIEAGKRGEFKDEAGAKRWLNSRGFDEFGKEIGPGSPLYRGVSSGILQRGMLGTGERLSRALGLEEAAAQFRRGAASASELEQERALLNTAPMPLGVFDRAPRSDAESRTFSGGELAGAFGTEIAKAYGAGKAGAALGRTATGQRIGARAAGMLAPVAKVPGGRLAAKVIGRMNPYSLAAINALQAIEDVGSLPEESTAGALAQLARSGEPGAFREALADALEAASETRTGRALTGFTVGALPEIAGLFLGQAPKAVRQVAVPAAIGAGGGALVGDENAATLGGLAGGMLGVRNFLRPRTLDEVLEPIVEAAPQAVEEVPAVIPRSRGKFPQGFAAGEELDVTLPERTTKQLLDDILNVLPEEPATPALNIAGSRRRATGVAQAEREAQRAADEAVARFNRDLTLGAAEGLRAETRRGATRIMEPIQAERDAQQIILRRNQERQAATTTQQKAAVERMHERENERLAGTPLGEALKRLAPAAVVGAAGLGALSQLDEESAPGAALLAGAFLPGMGRSLLRRPGRVVNPSAAGFLDKAYSRLETGVLNAKQERMSGRDWANALKGSVPQSEVEWTGLGRFLDENAGNTLSRDDVADYLANNRLEITERVIEPEYATNMGERSYGFSDYGAKTTYDATTRLDNRSNYREVLFTFEPKGGLEYSSPHYTEPNTLMHLRFFDVAEPGGKKALFVQEMQSDLHQEARKAGGYKTPEYVQMDTRRNTLNRASYDLRYGTPEVKAEVRRKLGIPEVEPDDVAAVRLKQEADAIKVDMDARFPRTGNVERPPEAPFAKTEEWTELGVKRALDEAVSKGYDRIVFANWPQITQATTKTNVFDDVNGIRVVFGTRTNAAVPTRVIPMRGGKSMTAIDIPDNQIARFVDDPDIIRRFDEGLASGNDEVIIRSDTPFTFGDKQLRPYYDEKIPSIIKKYLGSLGVKAELKKVQFPMQSPVRGAARTQPNMTLDITQEIKDKVLAGQRLLGATAVIGGAGALGAASSEAQAQAEDEEVKKAGLEFGFNLPTFLALGVGGAAMRSALTKVNAAKAALAAEKATRVDLVDLARRSAEAAETQRQATRQATRLERARQRIAQPAGPRPADAWIAPKDPADVFEFAARIVSDPEGLRSVSEAIEEGLATGRVVRPGKSTWEIERTIAKNLGVDAMDLATKDPTRTLSGPEFLALSNALNAENQRKILLRKVMDDVRTTAKDRQLASQLYDIVDTRLTTIFQRMVRDRGEYGNMLNLMKAVKAQSTNPADWLYRAQKLAGGRPLSPETADELIRAIDRGEFVKARMVLSKVKASNMSVLDKAGEFFQTALLSRIGRPIRDLISNSINSMDRRAQYALASKIDQIATGMGWFSTRSLAGNVGDINRAGKRGARLGWQQALELLRASPTREMTPEALDALERAARRYDFSDESSFTNPFMRAWGTFVRRTIAASDQPFYESAFAMAMETQARAIGANRGLKGARLEEFVNSTLATPPSEMIATAIAEGAEAVFQNQTAVGRAAAALGGRGAKSPVARFLGKQFIPFAQTPSAIATQAFEQTPLGLLNAGPEAILAKAGSSAAQRKLVMKLAKVSTGAAWMWAGYVLADEGGMNLFYPDDPNERARWQEENRIANSILVNGKWVALSGLLGPQAMLLTIGGLVRKYMEEDAKGLAAAIAQASAVGTAEGFIETPAMTGAQSVMDILKAATQDDPARMEEALGKALESQVTGYIPGIIQQAAAMGDVDEQGRVIMRDPMAGETLSEDIMNALRMGIPGQREQLPAKISPFGRVRSSGPGGLESLITPFRTTISQATPLTQALEQVGYFPATPTRKKAEGETAEMYRARRMAEGPQEQAFLERLLSGDDAAWQFVSEEAEQDYAETQNAAELVRAALRSYRAARTREQKQPE